MTSLNAIRSYWCRPGWAVLLAVCVLLKSFTVSAASAHDMDHGGAGTGYGALSDSPSGDDRSDDGNEGGDPFEGLLHANQCCLQDAMAVFSSEQPVWRAYPHSPPAVAPPGRASPLEGLLLRPPRLS